MTRSIETFFLVVFLIVTVFSNSEKPILENAGITEKHKESSEEAGIMYFDTRYLQTNMMNTNGLLAVNIISYFYHLLDSQKSSPLQLIDPFHSINDSAQVIDDKL